MLEIYESTLAKIDLAIESLEAARSDLQLYLHNQKGLPK